MAPPDDLTRADEGEVEGEVVARAPDGLAPGDRVGPYVVLAKLAEGGMGAVFDALHLGLERRVAIKTLHARVRGSAVARERFMREGRAAARVRHPHVIEVFDVGLRDDDTPYLVMERLEGEDLAALLQREGPIEVERAVELALPVIAAVCEAHARGVVHRDLKPENVFVALGPLGEPHPKVLDFGVAALIDERSALTQASVVVGTPSYMAPEQALNSRGASVASDQYPLGALLYECLVGSVPFVRDTPVELFAALARDPVPPPRSLRPGLPPALEAVILRALARDPAERFASVKGLGAALLPFASDAARSRWTSTFTTSVLRAPTVPAPRPPAPTVMILPGGARRS